MARGNIPATLRRTVGDLLINLAGVIALNALTHLGALGGALHAMMDMGQHLGSLRQAGTTTLQMLKVSSLNCAQLGISFNFKMALCKTVPRACLRPKIRKLALMPTLWTGKQVLLRPTVFPWKHTKIKPWRRLSSDSRRARQQKKGPLRMHLLQTEVLVQELVQGLEMGMEREMEMEVLLDMHLL